MLIARIFGTILRALSVIWFLSALTRIFLGVVGEGRSSNLWLGLISALVSVVTFKFGTWLKDRPKMRPVDQQVAAAKSRWWQSHFGFRLAVFSGVVLAVCAFFWQGSYERDYMFVLGPSLAFIVIHLGYRHFVAGPPKPADAEASTAVLEPLMVSSDNPIVIAELMTAALGLATPDDRASRDRAMNELIRRMSKDV